MIKSNSVIISRYRRNGMWEYKTVTFSTTFCFRGTIEYRSQEILDDAAKDGWELVNFRHIGILGPMMIFIFKKKMPE